MQQRARLQIFNWMALRKRLKFRPIKMFVDSLAEADFIQEMRQLATLQWTANQDT